MKHFVYTFVFVLLFFFFQGVIETALSEFFTTIRFFALLCVILFVLFAIFRVILLSDNLELLIPLSFFSFFDIFLIFLIALFSVSKIRWKLDGEREKSFFDVFGLALFSNMLSLSKGVLLCGVPFKSEGVSKELFLDMFLSILF